MKKLIGTGLFILGMIVAINVNAQRSLTMSCVNQISSLTEDQVAEITELNDAYQTEMDELRTEQRSTRDADEKTTIRETMDELRANHHEEVKTLMTDEQIAEFEELYNGGMYKAGVNRGFRAGTQAAQGRMGRQGQAFNQGRMGNRPGQAYAQGPNSRRGFNAPANGRQQFRNDDFFRGRGYDMDNNMRRGRNFNSGDTESEDSAE